MGSNCISTCNRPADGSLFSFCLCFYCHCCSCSSHCPFCIDDEHGDVLSFVVDVVLFFLPSSSSNILWGGGVGVVNHTFIIM